MDKQESVIMIEVLNHQEIIQTLNFYVSNNIPSPLISKGCCNKVSDLKQQKFVLSQFWRLEV